MNAAQKYPIQRYVKFERLVLVKEKGGYYHIPENVKTPDDAYVTVIEVLKLNEEPNEVFGILVLNTKNRIVSIDKISTGNINTCLVHPREVFKIATLKNAASIICFHNHPSGDPTPSQEDIKITNRLVEAGELMGIDVLDHVIIGDERFYSMKKEGVM